MPLRRKILILAILFFPAFTSQGQTLTPVVTAFGEYSYNATFGHQAALDLLADIPVNAHFEIRPGLQTSTAGIHTLALKTSTLMPISAGSLYMSNRFLFRDVVRSAMYDACLAVSFGYKWKWIDVEAGMFGRFMDAFDREWHSTDEIICEPFNLLYRIRLSLKPDTYIWNAYAEVADFDYFQMERMWQPSLVLGGRYDISGRLSIRAEAISKPSGMFHLNAEFYSITGRIGVTYQF